MSSGRFSLKHPVLADNKSGSGLQITSLPGRKVLSPSTFSVTFEGTSPQSKTSLVISKPDKTRLSPSPVSNKKTENIESAKKEIDKSKVPGIDSANGIKLVGFKLTNESGVAMNGGGASETNGKHKAWTPLTSKLPPCKVCGDEASGLHYGVNSCEACKAFFRRALKRKNLDFQCMCTPEERALGTDAPRKTTCPKCRYERCIKLGMSKDAIKIGRYTIGRKRQNDQEVKRLSANVDRKERLNSESSKSSGSPYSSGQVSSPEEVTGDIDKMTLQEKKDPPSSISTAKKVRRIANDETGLLFQSLTNSIFQILVENQSKTSSSSTNSITGNTEFSPMEQLLMKPFDPTLGKMSVEKPTDGEHKQFQFSSQPLNGLNTTVINVTHNTTGNTPVTVSRKGSDSDSSLSSSNQSNTSFTKGGNNNSPQSLQGSHSGGSLLSPGDATSPVYIASPIESTFSDQGFSKPSPMEALLMSPPSVGKTKSQNFIDENDLLEGKLKAFEEQQIVPNGEPIGFSLDDVEQLRDLPSVYIVDEGKGNENISSGPTVTSENLQEGDCDFFGDDVDIELNEDGLTIDELDIQLNEFDRFQCPHVRAGCNMSEEEIKVLIDKLSALALSLMSKFEVMSCEEIKERHKAYLEQFEMKQKMFGVSNLSQEEYMAFFNQTGIDIDNRQEMVIEMLKYLEDSISKLVQFAKEIPGFSDFDVDDQVLLVKSSRFEHDMIKFGGQKCVISSLNVVTTPWDKDYHISELQKLMPEEFCRQKAAMAEKVAELSLSIEEMAIVRALLITCPERFRMKLKQPDKVEAVHKKLIVCLLYLLEKRPPGHELTTSQLLELVFELREVGELHTKSIQEIFEIWPISENHKLLKEFVSE